jgi:hypothetical protein
MVELNLCSDNCKEYQFWNDYIQKYDNIACVILSEKTSLNSTGRNLRNKAIKLGYTCNYVSYKERNNLLNDIYEINISSINRQGKRMKESYLEYPKEMTENFTCDNHYSNWYGCFNDGKLVAYIVGAYCGNMVAFSMILGHAQYLNDGIMYLLSEYVMNQSYSLGCAYCTYSRWSDGTDGLRTFKHNLGFKITNLQ